MTFEQLSYFLALAEEKSFVRAAHRCGISQPSLTNAIRALVNELGTPLFERMAKGSELTRFGREIRPLLTRLHHGKLQALEFGRTFNGRSNPERTHCSDSWSNENRPDGNGQPPVANCDVQK